jgi:uncharacterized protein (DUF1015 family)
MAVVLDQKKGSERKSSLLRPFPGLRPAPGRSEEVIAPPYDVLSTKEARLRAKGKRWSFLHVSKAEIDLSEDVDAHAPAVYAKAAENMAAMVENGILMRDQGACYYIYRLAFKGHVQTGVAGAASIAAYNENKVRRHEFTRPSKEDDRVRQIEAVGAQTGPVMLAHAPSFDVASILDAETSAAPAIDLVADDGVGHTLWVVSEPSRVAVLEAALSGLDVLYIADGHHRSAAAARVAEKRIADGNKGHTESSEGFLAVAFAYDQMNILDYNRVVRDLNGHTPEHFLEKVAEEFVLSPLQKAESPATAQCFSMYVNAQWYGMSLRNPVPEDPVARLDISLLSDRLIAPILGICDPRRDERIDFIGGIRGLGELERRIDSKEMAVAFALHPTSMEDLMAVADKGEVMPPKSTWFEPKLADGLISYVLD